MPKALGTLAHWTGAAPGGEVCVGTQGPGLLPLFGRKWAPAMCLAKRCKGLAGRSESLDRAALWMERAPRPQPSLLVSFSFVVQKLFIQPSLIAGVTVVYVAVCLFARGRG